VLDAGIPSCGGQPSLLGGIAPQLSSLSRQGGYAGRYPSGPNAIADPAGCPAPSPSWDGWRWSSRSLPGGGSARVLMLPVDSHPFHGSLVAAVLRNESSSPPVSGHGHRGCLPPEPGSLAVDATWVDQWTVGTLAADGQSRVNCFSISGQRRLSVQLIPLTCESRIVGGNKGGTALRFSVRTTRRSTPFGSGWQSLTGRGGLHRPCSTLVLHRLPDRSKSSDPCNEMRRR
jgi:hypothetical protein